MRTMQPVIPVIQSLNEQCLVPRGLLVCPSWHRLKTAHAKEAEEEEDAEDHEETEEQVV